MEHMNLPTTLRQIGFEPTDANIRLLLDYLIPSTALTVQDEPRLLEAIGQIL